MKSPSHCIILGVHGVSMIYHSTDNAKLDQLIEVGSATFLPCEINYFLFFYTLFIRDKSLSPDCIQGEGNYAISPGGSIIKESVEIC